MYVEACKFDCCSHDDNTCTCKSMEAYSRACMDRGVRLNWRKTDRCRKSDLLLWSLFTQILFGAVYLQLSYGCVSGLL